MGRLTHDTTIHHFSHPHPLHLSSSTQNLQSLIPLSCAACTLPSYSSSSSWTYSCNPCNFHLHISCSQLPPLIQHPSHPIHPLTLLPIPAYPEAGCFDCDACGCNSTGFSYHCGTCSVDLHTACASMPLSVNHYLHVHPLTLAFFPPYDNKGFSCDVCGSLGENHWLYRCALCEFDVHLGCGARGGSRVASAPVSRSVSQQGVSRTGSGTLIRNIVGGIVDGASQQIGQNLVQGFMGGGGDGNNNGGGDEGGSSILNVGSAILGSVLGGGSSEN